MDIKLSHIGNRTTSSFFNIVYKGGAIPYNRFIEVECFLNVYIDGQTTEAKYNSSYWSFELDAL